MKKSKLDYINIFFTIILGILIFLNLSARFKNKEQEKILWNATIQSLSENHSYKNRNLIKIIIAKLFNNFNHSTSYFDNESVEFIPNKTENSINFNSSDKELLPDSLSLNYFSVDERKFYTLKTKIPYEKIRNLIKNKNGIPTLFFELQPKGKTILKMMQKINEQDKSEFIGSFTAKETNGDINMLIYKKHLSGKYNDYEGIRDILDFSDLIQNRYNWTFHVEMEGEERLQEVSAYSSTESIDILENKDDAKYRNIPRRFDLRWGNKQKYSTQFEFSAFEILTAFRKLDEVHSSEPVTINFKLLREKYPECTISKDKISIPLKNLFPELPIH